VRSGAGAEQRVGVVGFALVLVHVLRYQTAGRVSRILVNQSLEVSGIVVEVTV